MYMLHCVCIRVHVRIHVRACRYVHLNTDVYIILRVTVCVYMHVGMYAYVFMYVCKCMCTHRTKRKCIDVSKNVWLYGLAKYTCVLVCDYLCMYGCSHMHIV